MEERGLVRPEVGGVMWILNQTRCSPASLSGYLEDRVGGWLQGKHGALC